MESIPTNRSHIKSTIVLIGIFLWLTLPVSSQPDTVNYTITTGGISSLGEHAPFWLTNNTHGTYTPARHSGIFKLGAHSSLSEEKTVDYGFGVQLFNRYDNQFHNTFNVQQAYLEGKIGFIQVHAGSKQEFFGNSFHNLSSGSILISGNAPPIPKIAVKTDGFTEIPFTKGYLEFNAYYSDGRLEKNRHVEHPYVHYKHLSGKLGGDFPVNIQYGFHHAAMWGGKDPNYGKFPADLTVYKKIVTGQQGTENTTPVEGEKINVLGNHIGSRNFGLNVTTEKFEFGAYWQSIFEDGSGKGYRNAPDGLWGIYYKSQKKRQWLASLCIEYIQTTNQSGDVHQIDQARPIDSILGGNDNYFNHYIYHSGWTHQGFTMGSPLITSPLYDIHYSLRNKNGEHIAKYLPNNNIRAIHTGIQGWINSTIRYKLLFTYVQNYGLKHPPIGSFDNPEIREELYEIYKEIPYNEEGIVYYKLPGLDQYSGMIAIAMPVRFFGQALELQTKIAFDYSEFYGNNLGVSFKLTKHGILSK